MQLTIEELMQRWEMLQFIGIEKLHVTEQFKKYNKSFIVNGLSMQLEDEFAICTDYDDLLLNHCSVLMMFIQTCLTTIVLLPIEGGFQERLEFGNDGVVLIERA